MQVTNTGVAYAGAVTTNLGRVTSTTRADTIEAVHAKKDVAKIGVQSQARAIGAEAIINFSVSVSTEPHGYKITASGEGVSSAQPSQPPSVDVKF